MTSIVDLVGAAAWLIRSDSKGCVLVAADQRDALLDAFEQSGQLAMSFCRQRGLKCKRSSNRRVISLGGFGAQAAFLTGLPCRARSQFAGMRLTTSLSFMPGSRVSTSSRYTRVSMPSRRQFSTMV